MSLNRIYQGRVSSVEIKNPDKAAAKVKPWLLYHHDPKLAAELTERIPGLVINGDLKHVLPHMLNVSIPNISSEYLTLALDHAGVAVSTKSACREGEESQSHVVACLAEAAAKAGGTGGELWRAENTLRFSLGRETRSADITYVVTKLAKLINKASVVYSRDGHRGAE